MLAIALILLSIVLMLFIFNKPKKASVKPSQYDSVLNTRLANIKKIDSIKPVLLEQKYKFQKKASEKNVTAKAKIAKYKQSLKDGDTTKAIEHIDSALNTIEAVAVLQTFAQSVSDTIIAKQAVQIAAFEGLLTMTRTEVNRLNTQVIALQFENEELKDKLKKRRKKRGALLTGLIIAGGYLLLK